jgi:hypothetical protein
MFVVPPSFLPRRLPAGNAPDRDGGPEGAFERSAISDQRDGSPEGRPLLAVWLPVGQRS